MKEFPKMMKIFSQQLDVTYTNDSLLCHSYSDWEILSQINEFLFHNYFLGKTFPKIPRRIDRQAISLSTSDDDTNTEFMDDNPSTTNNDYVFRIIFFETDRSCFFIFFLLFIFLHKIV